MRSLACLLLAAALALPAPAMAVDFHVNMTSCRTTLAKLVKGEKALETSDVETFLLVCTRSGRSLACDIIYRTAAGNERENAAPFTITEETPPILLFTREERVGTARMFTRIQVDTKAGSVVSVTDLFDPAFAGSKTCRGLFLTEEEMRYLRSLAK